MREKEEMMFLFLRIHYFIQCHLKVGSQSTHYIYIDLEKHQINYNNKNIINI